MGKSAKTKQNSQSEAGPWPYVEAQAKSFVDKLGGLGGIGMTDAQKQAFGQLKSNVAGGNPYAGSTNQLAERSYQAANNAYDAQSGAQGASERTMAAGQGVLGTVGQATGGAQNAFDIGKWASGMGMANANPADRTGAVSGAYSDLQKNIGGYARGDYVDPMSNPLVRQMMTQVGDSAANRINAQFAGAGRDLSGANQMAVGRGVTEAQLPLLLNEYARQQGQQLNAAGQLYGAGNQTSQTLSALDQARQGQRGQAVAMGQAGADISRGGLDYLSTGANLAQTGSNILGQGVQQAGQGVQFGQMGNQIGQGAVQLGQAGLDANNYGANAMLDLEQQMKGMPYEDMSLWASLLFPAAGLGGTEKTTGTAKTKQGLFSDARLKDDVKEVGTLADGQRIYAYHYKGDPEKTTHIGVMAQEAETKTPEAVGVDRASGFRVVDYGAATRKAAEIVAARRKRKG